MSHQSKLVQGPKHWDNHGSPTSLKYGIEVTVIQDEVTTVAILTNQKTGSNIANGYARRHPSDERNNEIGHDLAVARAFRMISDRYISKVEQDMTAEPDPMREPLKAMKRANRAEQQKRKNVKRREARERYLREQAKSQSKELTEHEIRDALGRAFGYWS